jgi:hypothetical protein
MTAYSPPSPSSVVPKHSGARNWLKRDVAGALAVAAALRRIKQDRSGECTGARNTVVIASSTFTGTRKMIPVSATWLYISPWRHIRLHNRSRAISSRSCAPVWTASRPSSMNASRRELVARVSALAMSEAGIVGATYPSAQVAWSAGMVWTAETTGSVKETR